MVSFFFHVLFVGMDVLHKVNSPSLKLQLDLFHLQFIAGNITRNVSELLPYVGKFISSGYAPLLSS